MQKWQEPLEKFLKNGPKSPKHEKKIVFLLKNGCMKGCIQSMHFDLENGVQNEIFWVLDPFSALLGLF